MIKIYSICLILFSTCSCFNNLKNPKIQDNVRAANVSFETPENIKVEFDKKQPLIELERRKGECYTGCPLYTILIYLDGTILYNGMENVEKKGRVGTKISEEKIHRLIEEFEKVNIFEFRDRYIQNENCGDKRLSDAPALRLTYNNGKSTKTIFYYLGCSEGKAQESLKFLGDLIDETVESENWIRKQLR